MAEIRHLFCTGELFFFFITHYSDENSVGGGKYYPLMRLHFSTKTNIRVPTEAVNLENCHGKVMKLEKLGISHGILPIYP